MSFFKNSIIVILFSSFFFCCQVINAQKLSVDGAVLRNVTQNLKGINTAVFYHFTEKFSGGLELTRFYAKTVAVKAEMIERSAWDVDLNFHYDIVQVKRFSLYPILGVGYNELKEKNKQLNESAYEKFWAINTGAGIRLDAGILKPHMEYTAVWINRLEHIFLAGISYEFGEKKNK
jgi:hypothetical protein